MTRDDVEHLAQVVQSMHQAVDEEAFLRLIYNMMWAIRRSSQTVEFDPGRFRLACHSEGLVFGDPTLV